MRLLSVVSNVTLTDHLLLTGRKAWECLSVLVSSLICEREWIDAVVIAPDVDDADVIEAQLRQITIRMKPQTSPKDLVWELSKLFASGPTAIQ